MVSVVFSEHRHSNYSSIDMTQGQCSNLCQKSCSDLIKNVSPPGHLSLILDYSTGVQIVSCTLSDDSVLSESTGLCNPVLCVSQ